MVATVENYCRDSKPCQIRHVLGHAANDRDETGKAIKLLKAKACINPSEKSDDTQTL